VALCRASRPADAAAPDFVKQYVAWGAGPRASQYLFHAAKARAILAGRYAAAVEDVRALAMPVPSCTACSELPTPRPTACGPPPS
jgi:MoxR-like ATPase